MMLDFSEDVSKIEEFLDKSHYEEAIEGSFKIVEKSLETLFEKVFTKLKIDLQSQIIAQLKEEHSGKNFNDLMIGEKLRIFDSFKLLSYIDIHLDKEVNTKKLLELNDLRKASTHQKRKMSKGEAYYAYSIILRFLEKIGYKSLENQADTIKDEHLNASKKQDKKVLDNLPLRDYVEFIGREDKIKQIINLLLHEKVHVLSIDGIGGVGKSALALEVGYTLKDNKIFDAIVWVSAKKDRLTYKGIEEVDNTFDNLEDLFDEILNVFNEADFLKHGSIDTKERKVLEILSENNCLLIVDNLETIDDENLKTFLIDIKFPIESKVLITSRKRLGQVEYVVYLEKFSMEETTKYIQSQLKHRSYSGYCSDTLIKDIHLKTGGIPLAIKVIIPWIVEGKIKERLIDDIDKETDILKFCFDKVFNEFLSEEAKKLFCILSLAPTEISEAALRFVSGLKDKDFNESLSSLINYSLIFMVKKDTSSEEFFCMLPLTQEFGIRVSSVKYPGIKEQINKTYLKFIELSKSEEHSAKTAMSINKAEEARRLFSLGNVDDAANLFKESIEYDNNCDYAIYLYAVFCRERQDFGQARTLIERALGLNDKNPYYWSEYATILELWGDFKKTEKVLEKALEKTNRNRGLVMKLVLIKSKLQKNNDVINLAKNSIIYDFKEDKDKFINTLLTIALLEGHWRISYDYSNRYKNEDALNELLKGISELNELINKKVVFHDNGKLLWEEKKTFNKLGDIAILRNDKKSAKEFYLKSLYPVALFDDRKRHNQMINAKLAKISTSYNV